MEVELKNLYELIAKNMSVSDRAALKKLLGFAVTDHPNKTPEEVAAVQPLLAVL